MTIVFLEDIKIGFRSDINGAKLEIIFSLSSLAENPVHCTCSLQEKGDRQFHKTYQVQN